MELLGEQLSCDGDSFEDSGVTESPAGGVDGFPASLCSSFSSGTEKERAAASHIAAFALSSPVLPLPLLLPQEGEHHTLSANQNSAPPSHHIISVSKWDCHNIKGTSLPPSSLPPSLSFALSASSNIRHSGRGEGNNMD
ncbi:hypothetical protein FQN60_007896 [Etheostoma spectabile]|uniref:Uncharacterized protein n=1 Tax=Etheostoma spectabile TaxID=54343 RepID=A0A5J5CBC1_9PERO|nr:hypothetical protein FQN60_007896 [Etheostoma spectabile]